MAITPYTLQQAEDDISTLRGQVDLMSEVLSLNYNGFDVPNKPANGVSLHSYANFLKYVSAIDGNDYSNGHIIPNLASTQSVSSTTQATVTGLSIPIAGVGSYYFMANITYIANSTNIAYLTMGGPSVSDFAASIAHIGSNQPTVVVQQTTLGVNTGLGGPTMVNAHAYMVFISGYVYANGTAGNLTVQAASSANAASYTIQKASSLALFVSS